MLRYLWLSVAVILLDQGVKVWLSQIWRVGQGIVVIPGFLNFRLVHNTGAAFSFLAGAGGWQRWLLVAIALLVIVVLVAILRRLKPGAHWIAIALTLILGGAMGNLIDRIRLGYVVDFIGVHWGNLYWPYFNIADSAISIGAVMLIIDAFRRH
ncbi:signal peptidase II [Candidatus Igneacidithiobacillus taiwanensis]|uniref:signal peptidase II n=1 Tax=Candidatus Igneacidithiobacillus taiwanensis TaxID=1945924 RepID=UPI002897E2FA|nr:signal peptidase II [Candidatus Igneacidithiobacillus taiwanensis]